SMSSPPVALSTAPVVAARRSRIASSDRWFAFWLVLPTILVVIGVSIYPVAYAVWTSLHNKNPAMGLDVWVGLENYRMVFAQAEFRTAIGVTFRFAIAVVVLRRLRHAERGALQTRPD
ncbi:MAG: hypothetical protein ACRDJC_19540, partial [Thermomicrobiales bacterium]